MSKTNTIILKGASVAGGVGLLAGLYSASQKDTPTWKTYLGHAVLGFVAGSAIGGVAHTLLTTEQP